MKINLTLINLNSIVVDGVDPRDMPDFVDAYADYAEWNNGRSLTDEELDALKDQYPEIIHQLAIENIIGSVA